MKPLPSPDTNQFLLAFDFDGTLHCPGQKPAISPELFDILKELRERHQIRWGIATGRALPLTIQGIQEGNFPFLPDFLICRERDIFLPGEFGNWTSHRAWNDKAHRDHEKLFRKARRCFKKIKQHIEQHTQAQWVEHEYDPAGIISSTEAEMEEILQVAQPWITKVPKLGYQKNKIYLRFCDLDYSKGTALQEVGRGFHLDAQKTLAAGDQYNDLSMLSPKIARMMITPSNALDSVKKQVTEAQGFIATQEASLGVIEGLKHYFPR